MIIEPPAQASPLLYCPDDSPDRGSRSSMTDVSEIVPELAQLSKLSNVPKLTRPLSANDITTVPEAHIVALIETSMSVQAILDESPLREEQTLRFLARLITSGLLTCADVG
jgi:hypothetical protein